MNIFYLPVRLPLTVLGAFFAGFTGFMTLVASTRPTTCSQPSTAPR